MADTAALVVALSAQLTKFEKDMKQANAIADREVRRIEERFAKMVVRVPGIDELSTRLKALATGAGLAALTHQMIELTRQVNELGDTAERVGLTTDQVQEFRFAVAATGGDLEKADTALDRFSKAMSEAAEGTNDLAKFLRLNNVAITDARGNLLPMLTLLEKYANLVKNAKTPADQLRLSMDVFGRQAGPQMTEVLREGAEGLRKWAEEARKNGAVIDKELIEKAQKLNDEWSKLKLTFAVTAQQVAVSTWDLLRRSLNSVVDAMAEFINKYIEMKNLAEQPTAMGAPGEETSGFNVPGVGFVPNLSGGRPNILINKPSPGAPLPTARPSNIPSGDQTTQMLRGQDEAFKKLIETQQHRIELLKLEGDLIGESIETQTYFKTAIELENAALTQNIPLTAERNKKIEELATAAGKAAGETARLKDNFKGMNEAIQFFGNEAIDIMIGLTNRTMTAADAMKQLTNTLIKALLQASLLGQGPLAGIMGLGPSTAGGTGGLLGALFTKPPGMQGGGPVAAGHPYWVGERGKELFVPGESGSIVPSHLTPGRSTSGSTVEINNYVAADTETKQTTQEGPSGERIVIDIVRKAQARGEFDPVNRARFGLRPNKVR